ncbi:MAG: Hint domain-containing protein [Pseudomonadota bacterium]
MADKLNGLIFSEFLVDNPLPDGTDTDGDGTANETDEFIEIQNTTGAAISLDGYELWSKKSGQLFAFGPGDTIDAGQTATVVGEYTGTPPPGFFSAGLTDGVDWLQDGQGKHHDSLYLVDTSTGEYLAFSFGHPPRSASPPSGFPGTAKIGSGESIHTQAPNGIGFTRDQNGDWVETDSPNPGTPGVVCFAAGTMIATPTGDRPVEHLRVGDFVTVLGGYAQPIQWCASRRIGAATLAARPDLRPIAFEPRWTGAERRLLLSRQHAVFVTSDRYPDGCLVRAAQLQRMKGGAVRIAEGVHAVTYVHFMLPSHQVVFADGVAVESFYPGAWAIETLAPLAKLTLLAQFAGCPLDDIVGSYGPPKAPYIPGRDLATRVTDLKPVLAESAMGHAGADLTPPGFGTSKDLGQMNPPGL